MINALNIHRKLNPSVVKMYALKGASLCVYQEIGIITQLISYIYSTIIINLVLSVDNPYLTASSSHPSRQSWNGAASVCMHLHLDLRWATAHSKSRSRDFTSDGRKISLLWKKQGKNKTLNDYPKIWSYMAHYRLKKSLNYRFIVCLASPRTIRLCVCF